jgi:hypothetical protein
MQLDPKDLPTFSAEKLLELKGELEGDLASIRTQIEVAQKVARETGEYASEQWWTKVNWALRTKGRQVQTLQLELHRRKSSKTSTVEARFVTLARKRLPAAEFQALLREAQAST